MSQISSKESSNDKSKSTKSNCSARIIPFYIDENKNIYLVMARVKFYGDWTALGGRCTKICGNCPEENDEALMDCMYTEMEEESHLSIMRTDIEIICNPSSYYIDKKKRHNNIRFAKLNKDRDVTYVKTMYYDEELLKQLAKHKKGADFLETVDIEFLPLHGTFLKYVENTLYKRGAENEKIDYSILEPFYTDFKVKTPAQLVAKIDAFINKCISK